MVYSFWVDGDDGGQAWKSAFTKNIVRATAVDRLLAVNFLCGFYCSSAVILLFRAFRQIREFRVY